MKEIDGITRWKRCAGLPYWKQPADIRASRAQQVDARQRRAEKERFYGRGIKQRAEPSLPKFSWDKDP
jgi:hypothetical protein